MVCFCLCRRCPLPFYFLVAAAAAAAAAMALLFCFWWGRLFFFFLIYFFEVVSSLAVSDLRTLPSGRKESVARIVTGLLSKRPRCEEPALVCTVFFHGVAVLRFCVWDLVSMFIIL